MVIINTFYFIGIIIIFCGLQFILSKTQKNVFIKYFLISAITIGLLFSVILYLNIFWTDSPSVIAENQYFAKFIGFYLIPSFIGCLLGLLSYKLSKNNK